MYWDPLPTVAASNWLLLAYDDGRELGPSATYLRGEWARRDWRNVPGPFYGAETDTCWMGRDIAPDNVLYEDDYGTEVVFRQPRNPEEVRLVLSAAYCDPFGGYGADGDEHWTVDLVRAWWADRRRLAEWIDDLHRRWSVSARADERENTIGLRAYANYLDDGLKTDLTGYAFWLDHHRPPRPDETLPDLG